ncbi:hypothetical protein BMJ24_17765 [Sinorhizobium medicae]|nr:hypothetical protein BMJ24_17765 [Sinorhizobium medicae]
MPRIVPVENVSSATVAKQRLGYRHDLDVGPSIATEEDAARLELAFWASRVAQHPFHAVGMDQHIPPGVGPLV